MRYAVVEHLALLVEPRWGNFGGGQEPTVQHQLGEAGGLVGCVEIEPGEIGSDLCLQTFHRSAGAGKVIDQREPSEVETGRYSLVDVAGRKFGDEFTGVSKLDIALVGQRNAVFRRVRSEPVDHTHDIAGCRAGFDLGRLRRHEDERQRDLRLWL